MSRARQILDRVAVELPTDLAPVGGDAAGFSRAYYAMQEPCPLLVDGRCSVRNIRPLVCREYLMSSAPQNCFEPTLEHVVKIRRRRHVSAGFQRVSARFDEAEWRLLPVALRDAPDAAAAKTMSGPKMATLLLR